MIKIPSTGMLKTVREGKPNPYDPKVATSNAITLNGKVQLIIRFYGEVEDIFKNFDFAHSMVAYQRVDSTLHYHSRALECMLAKELFYVHSLYPLTAMLRTRKFIKRGWRISAGQMFKIMFRLSGMDLSDIELLKDQLLGVDSFYMMAFLGALEQCPNELPIEGSYVNNLIDNIFNGDAFPDKMEEE